MKKLLSLILIAAALAVITLVAAGCEDNEDEPTVQATPAAEEARAVEAAMQRVLGAVQDRDPDRLRALMTAELGRQAPDADVQRLAACVPAGATVSPIRADVRTSGATATVDTAWVLARQDGQLVEAQRTWTFARQPDGTWLLSELPDCWLQ